MRKQWWRPTIVYAMLFAFVIVFALPGFVAVLSFVVWGLRGPYRAVDPSQWRLTAEQLLDMSLPSDVQVENCVQLIDYRDPGPIVRLSGTVEAVEELRKRIPEHSVEPEDNLPSWHSDLPWFTIPAGEVECRLSRLHRAGFVAFLSKPVNGRVTMLVTSFD